MKDLYNPYRIMGITYSMVLIPFILLIINIHGLFML
uniref:Uncharacterized protein n=1 Tax=Rhizophora mucronata TaxID=61149 RepID=A0A2P2PXA1_RHIMU